MIHESQVESSQQRWLADNETLYIELERALHDNQKLREQIASWQDTYPTKEFIYD